MQRSNSPQRVLIAMMIALLLGGCTTVRNWLPESPPDVAEVETNTDEPVANNIAVDRFRQTALPLQREHYDIIETLEAAVDAQQQASVLAISEELKNREKQPSLVLFAVGEAWLALGESDKAVNSWQQAIDINADNYFAHNALAMMARAEGDFEQAKLHYNRALSAWPDYAIGYRNRGILFDLYVGDKAAALNDYIRYKQLLERQGKSTQQADRWIREMQRAIQ